MDARADAASDTDAASGEPDAGSASGCVDDGLPTDVTPPEVEGSGLSGPIGELSDADKQAYCDWLWALPGYGDSYCCHGVFRPQRVAVEDTESPETCVADLSRFDSCEAVRIEHFEDCAVDRLGRPCGTPAGCLAFGHGALTSTCYTP